MRNTDPAQLYRIGGVITGVAFHDGVQGIFTAISHPGDIFKCFFRIQRGFNRRGIHRPHHRRLQLRGLQCVEHLEALHDRIKLVGPARLPVLLRLKHMDHSRSPGGQRRRNPCPVADTVTRPVIVLNMISHRLSVTVDFHSGTHKTIAGTITGRADALRTDGLEFCSE
ncbi:Uncharacterised protein [Escherichia coli]|nr:Uncharacterised protein [Escherichia coli]